MKQEFFILKINQIDGIFRSETEFKSSNEKYDWENYDWKDLEDDIKQQGILEVLGVCKIKDSEYEYMSGKVAKALEDIKALNFLEEIEIFDILDNLKLTEKEKRYIELRFEDLTMTEISEDLEESAYRVRNKIRKKFELLYKEKVDNAP